MIATEHTTEHDDGGDERLRTEESGIISNIPPTPISSPPMVTATSTHMPGRPMEVPTTLG